MEFKHKSISIDKLVSAIEDGKLDLQPNFQRGEVWSEPKKQRLIDSILRGWYVPPVHVIRTSDGSELEVLDGQQRLRAIFEFAKDGFAIDSSVDPENLQFQQIHGRKYSQLPQSYRRKFDDFQVSVFTLEDYKPAEPGELFFRLNQPATLTTAEQRNAFYGSARDQVKKWIKVLGENKIDKSVVGFSNNRMAYDDTLARVALSVERKTLIVKVTADDLVRLYRSPRGYSSTTDRRIQRAIDVFIAAKSYFAGLVRFNKATLFSWLVFIVRANEHIEKRGSSDLAVTFGRFVCEFTASVESAESGGRSQRNLWESSEDRNLLHFYQDRARSRVADVSSVILRDLVIWIYFDHYLANTETSEAGALRRALQRQLNLARNIYREASKPVSEESLERVATEKEWGVFV